MKFLHDAWYPAGWASELREQIVGLTLLELPVILYRDAAGKAHALGGRCPHRFAPLAQGKLIDGAIECAYHGIRFGETGKCTLIPGGDGRIPANMRVPSYPLIERDGILWIWMGEPQQANAATIIDLSDRLSSPAYSYVTGSMQLRANYQLVFDNLIDPSHGQFLHGELLKRDGFFEAPHEVLQTGTTVSSERVIRNATAPPAYAQLLEKPDILVDWWTRAQWDPPGVFRLDNGVTPAGHDRDEGIRRCGVHLLSPETETSTHYWYAHVRNYRLNDPEMDEGSRRWQRTVFNEQDRPMLEAVQQMMGTLDFASLHPVLVGADEPAMRIRKIMRQLIDKQRPAHVAS